MIRTILTLSVLLLPTAGFACSCAFDDLPLKEAVKQSLSNADSVVLAQAQVIHIKVRTEEEPIPFDIELDGVITQFNQVQSWKGSHGKSFHTRINTAGGMCGYSFSEGKTYLLYLYGADDDGYYTTSTCSRTKPLRRVERELEVLNDLTQQINAADPDLPLPEEL